MGGMNDVGGDNQVVIDELAAQRVVGDDAADLGGREKHHLRTRRREPAIDRGLIGQVDLPTRHGQDLDPLAREPAHQRAADHAAMAGDKNRLSLQSKWHGRHQLSSVAAAI